MESRGNKKNGRKAARETKQSGSSMETTHCHRLQPGKHQAKGLKKEIVFPIAAINAEPLLAVELGI